MYTVWIKIDETLPWIELKGNYLTRSEARRAAKDTIKRLEVKIAHIPEQKRAMSPLATIRTR